MTTTTTAKVARARVRRTHAQVSSLEAKAEKASLERDAAMMDAQDLGATYADLMEDTGLSTARITQILRRERERRANA